MIDIALLTCVALILGLIVLLLLVVGEQQRLKAKPSKSSKRSAASALLQSGVSAWPEQTNSLQNLARLRAQAKRTGRKLSSTPQTSSKKPSSHIEESRRVVDAYHVIREERKKEETIANSSQPALPAEPTPASPEPLAEPTHPPLIPDHFTPPPRPPIERKLRKPTQYYPKLERLLRGDREAADRLVQNLLIAYPDKSERWCYEKAIHDLERDRY